MTDNITLQFTTYVIKGVAVLIDWYSQRGYIPMKTFNLDNIDDKTIEENLNDNGFGVQSIEGAIVDIYKSYEGHLQYMETRHIGNVTEADDIFITEKMDY